MNQLTRHLFAKPARRSVCRDAAKIIEPMLDDTQCDFCRGRSTTERISTLQQIFKKSWEHAKDLYTHVLSTSGKYMAGFLVKSFGGVVGVQYGVDGWPLLTIK